MKSNIKVRRLTFDNKNPKQSLNKTDIEQVPGGIRKLVIEIAELETDNPCDIIIVVTAHNPGNLQTNPEYLYQYRDKMLFQDGKYIVRLNLDFFIEEVSQYDIEVIHEHERNFILTAYLTPIPKHL